MNLSLLNDEQLISLLKEKSESAFTEIYNRYWAEMYYHAFKILRDEEHSKDVVQDVFSGVWLKSESINTQVKLSGYLYISVRNVVFNLISKQKVRSDYLSSIAEFMEESSVSLPVLYEDKEILELVEQEIQNLPEKMRIIFELSRKENLSHKEIAEKLGISDQTVKKQVQNALKILKPKLGAAQAGIFVLFLMR